MNTKAGANTSTKSRGGRPSKRDYILEKAEHLVLEQGASQLTFDALTETTGISKGGLLYHFESKEALIMAMLERYAGQRERRIEDVLAQGKGLHGSDQDLKAILLAEISEPKERLALDSAILAAVANNPELLAPIRERNAELWQRLDSAEAGGVRARIAWKAAMGHRLLLQFGLLHETPEQTQAFATELLAMLEPVANSDTSDSVFG
ncbi:TetR/AcrR family transcriptional regulator [Aliidiomarina indica]|uniref:TetR/AcrR family transcriptional regulator n=1 Tax=Aliidiomarina indica TaxID=2749147 RepID=UPI00188FF1D6|nr:TetR/AcrR family transcriptional regulator [Aliidiomarina indica]